MKIGRAPTNILGTFKRLRNLYLCIQYLVFDMPVLLYRCLQSHECKWNWLWCSPVLICHTGTSFIL